MNEEQYSGMALEYLKKQVLKNYFWVAKQLQHGYGVGKEKDDKTIITSVYPHDFGLIVPKKTGIAFEQQTQGVCCNHVLIEGVYIPLHRPRCYNPEHKHEAPNWERDKPVKDLLRVLQQANYDSKENVVAKLWKEIQKSTGIYFEDVEAPNYEPRTQEGLRWIKITKLKYNSGMYCDMSAIIGMTVALIYPNCD